MPDVTRGFSFCCLFVALVLSMTWQADARLRRGTSGILEGRITEKGSGVGLQGVNVLLVGTLYGAATDAEGYFEINAVKAGVYDVRMTMVGYKPVVYRGVVIKPDLRTRIDLEMESASIELDAVEVRVVPPVIQRDLAATAFNVADVKLQQLPISSFREVLLLQPSTTLEGNVRGGKTTEVSYLVDGLPVQDVLSGGLGSSLPLSSISGMTVTTGGFEAEYGGALSGVVNVITKGGSDKELLTARLERDSWLPKSVNEQTDGWSELEVAGGGSIIASNLFYFTAHTLTISDTRWWQDFQQFFSSPVTWSVAGFSKVEFLSSRDLRFTLQGLYDLQRWRDYEFSWRFNLDGLPARRKDAGRIALSITHMLSPRSFYTASLSSFYAYRRIGEEDPSALSLSPYQYDLFLRYVISGDRNWWARSRQWTYSLKVDFTHYADRTHLLKGGMELQQYDLLSNLIKYEPQLTYFGKPIESEVLLNYSNRYHYWPRSGSVYIQDRIELVRDGTSFNLGLRWDFLDPRAERPMVEFIPTKPNEYDQVIVGTKRASLKSQVSPRLGFVAPIAAESFCFFNYGHYFQFPLFEYLYAGLSPSQIRTGSRTVLAGNPDLEPERTVAWEIGFKHGLDERSLLSVTYFSKTFTNQVDSKTLVPYDSKYAGDFGFATYVNTAEARSEGIEIVLSREQHEQLRGSISYTYMKAEGLSEYVDQRINYEEWGFPLVARPFPLSWDQRHTVKADLSFALPGEVECSLIGWYSSPRPYTRFPTRDGLVPVDTTLLLLPNNDRMGDVLFVNAKLQKSFRLDAAGRYVVKVFADIRNLFNRRNVRWVDSNGRVGGELGDPSAYYESRRVRVGLRVEL